MRRGDIFPMVLFQFTPLREGRPGHGGFYHRHRHFNSRPSARGDGIVPCWNRRGTNFNSRPSARGDRSRLSSVGELKNFNSRPSARGDQRPRIVSVEADKFQFTPLREGRPIQQRAGRAGVCISIHAPPRGATASGTYSSSSSLFQFTPLREGRPGHGGFYHRHRHFNSRPSARGDGRMLRMLQCSETFQFTPLREGRHSPEGRKAKLNSISIHAPPRGATLSVVVVHHLRKISIHAPPRGATFFISCPCFIRLFQFTPLREGRRRFLLFIVATPMYFNSRPSARGDDGCGVPSGDCQDISIHAPPRGATESIAGAARALHISIHAPPRGATGTMGSRLLWSIFQFTPLREGRHMRRLYIMRRGISIHAPPRGATAKDMQFLQIFCSTLTNQHGLTIVPRNLSRLFW